MELISQFCDVDGVSSSWKSWMMKLTTVRKLLMMMTMSVTFLNVILTVSQLLCHVSPQL